MQKIYVGIGGGAIQLGLWAYYASSAGMRVILCDVDTVRVNQIKKNKNFYFVNIAYFDRIAPVRVGPVEIYDLNLPEERKKVLGFIRVANDIVTAVPDISVYQKGVSRLLREGLLLRKNLPVVLYASENQIKSAKILERLVYPKGTTPPFVQFCDTVIARMGGLHCERRLMKKSNLTPIVSGGREAILTEDFDRIIIERERLSGSYSFERGFSRFCQTDNIGFYEERKLFGHNAVHSLLGFVGKLKGYKFMSQYNGDPDFGYIGVDALLKETGAWFKKKYKGTREETATEDGYRLWAIQLCRRIVSPFLYDPIERIIRDPQRKLGWNDRLIGAIRRALSTGVMPGRYALGVAAAIYRRDLTRKKAISELKTILEKTGGRGRSQQKILSLAGDAFEVIKGWKENKCRSLWEYSGKEGYDAAIK